MGRIVESSEIISWTTPVSNSSLGVLKVYLKMKEEKKTLQNYLYVSFQVQQEMVLNILFAKQTLSRIPVTHDTCGMVLIWLITLFL